MRRGDVVCSWRLQKLSFAEIIIVDFSVLGLKGIYEYWT